MSADQAPEGLQHVEVCAHCPTAKAALRQVTLSCPGWNLCTFPWWRGRIWWGEESSAWNAAAWAFHAFLCWVIAPELLHHLARCRVSEQPQTISVSLWAGKSWRPDQDCYCWCKDGLCSDRALLRWLGPAVRKARNGVLWVHRCKREFLQAQPTVEFDEVLIRPFMQPELWESRPR